MAQYFCKESKTFEDFQKKFKSGQIVDLTAEEAGAFNRVVPGMFEAYVPAKHTPAPKLDEAPSEPVEEPAPVAAPVAAPEIAPVIEETPAPEVKPEKKSKKSEKAAA